MILEPTPLDGLLLVKPEKHGDERGFFSRLWCAEEFAAAGILFLPRQISASFNAGPGTLRGMHWQAEPYAEAKLVRVTSGHAYDVAVDIRPDSRTRWKWFGFHLRADSHVALFIPKGFAHGFVTLTEATEILYVIDQPYHAEAACGARFDDPVFSIAWPREPQVISDRDRSWPLIDFPERA